MGLCPLKLSSTKNSFSFLFFVGNLCQPQNSSTLFFVDNKEILEHIYSVTQRCIGGVDSIKTFLHNVECDGPGQQELRSVGSDHELREDGIQQQRIFHLPNKSKQENNGNKSLDR